MPTPTISLSLQKSNDIILTNTYCASSSNAWLITSYLWQALILVSASVLAFQSRDVIEEMNESKSLGFLVYSQSIFLIIRILVAILSRKSDFFPSSYQSPIMSIILSIDIITAMMIYMGPKFYSILMEKRKNNTNASLPHLRLSRDGKEKQRIGTPDSVFKQFGLPQSNTAGFMALRKAGINVIKSKSECLNTGTCSNDCTDLIESGDL